MVHGDGLGVGQELHGDVAQGSARLMETGQLRQGALVHVACLWIRHCLRHLVWVGE